ncbi:MAG: hypothetical protein IJJ33_08270, partial [Victivallales bacterium]|nr:hypothetical protein [Victivallales bacterium]
GTFARGGYVTDFNSPVGYVSIFPLDDNGWRWHFRAPGLLTYGLGESGKTYRKGDRLRYAYACATIVSAERNAARMELLAALLTGHYQVSVKQGKLLSRLAGLTLLAEGGSAQFDISPVMGFGIDLPIQVAGVADNGCAAVWSSTRPWFRFAGVDEREKKLYFQEPVELGNHIWAGNVFVTDNPQLKLTLAVDGQTDGKPPFLEVHNPGYSQVEATVHSPPGTPMFGGKSLDITVPPGASQKVLLAP